MKIGDNILARYSVIANNNLLETNNNLLETNFMNLPPNVFDVDHVAKIRSELSITVLEKNEQNYRLKKVT